MTTYQSFVRAADSYRTIPVTQSFFTDTLTPIHMFHALKDEAVYMLESQDPESPWSNFSFIGLDPMVEIKQQGEHFAIQDLHNQEERYESSLKEAFENVVEHLQVKEAEVPLPFKGGGVGYISYDAISDYEPVPRAIEDDLKLSNYHFIFCQTLIAYHHKTKETTILSFARLNQQVELNEQYEQARQRIKTVQKKLTQHSFLPDLMLSDEAPENKEPLLKSNYEADQYKADVETIKEYIRSGDIFQAVLSQRFQADTKRTGFELYRVLRKV